MCQLFDYIHTDLSSFFVDRENNIFQRADSRSFRKVPVTGY